MTPLECLRECDVIDAIASCRWPDRVDEELRDHVACCAVCTDVAEVASAMHADHETSLIEAVALAPSHVVWLRAQARARAEAVREAARPIAVMQAIGLASAAAVISVAIGFVAYWVWARADWFQAFPSLSPVAMETMGFAVRGTLLAVGLWLILAPVAVYLVAADD